VGAQLQDSSSKHRQLKEFRVRESLCIHANPLQTIKFQFVRVSLAASGLDRTERTLLPPAIHELMGTRQDDKDLSCFDKICLSV
jgi:hypothetical protein